MTTEAINPSAAVADVEQESLQEYASRMATYMAWPAGLLVFLLVVFLNLDRNPIPMMEDMRSFGIILFLTMLPITLIASGIGFYLSAKAWNARVGENRQRKWIPPILPAALAYTLVVGFAIALMLHFVEMAFQHLSLITLQAAGSVAAPAALLTYWVVNRVMTVKTSNMLTMIVIIIAGGVYLTATTIDDPLWWQISFSYLGKMESNAKMIFNSTLIFSGILLLAWMGYFMNDFRILERHGIATARGVQLVRIGLAFLAIGVMCVGIFKSNYTPFSSLMHNLSAYSLAVAFGLLMFGGKWIVPGFSREFFVTSWTLVALLIGTMISAGLGRMNTVGLEIVCFALGMIWLSVFVNNTEQITVKLEPKSFPDIGGQ